MFKRCLLSAVGNAAQGVNKS